MLRNGDKFNHKIYGRYKKDLLGDLHGTVVEIGPGSGVNFDYLPKDIEWIGVEPNEAFHKTLQDKAKRLGLNARLVKGTAQGIPLPDGSADAVVCTLVLCSVPDPGAVAREIVRILKPTGKLAFIEHVAAQEGTGLRKAQNLLNPINRFFADGCNCNRETWSILEHAGFSSLDLHHQVVKEAMSIHSPHIMGIATR